MFKRKPLELKQPSEVSAWHGGAQRHVDTVIFVHGILGSFESTWGQFPSLLASDDDLPHLDILCWGYRTGFVPGSYQDIETEGDGLISDIESLVRDNNHVFLVGHSMGGLVILKGITNRIRDQGGPNHPVRSVNRIVLYATPLHGSAFANVVLAALNLKFITRLILWVMPGKQLADLRRGDFCNQLLTDTNELIYRPPTDSLLAKRAIPVLTCVAKHDQAVSTRSAIGIFKTPPPKYLEGTHTSVKLPDHHNDLRYLALKHQLVEGLTKRFHELCLEVKTSPDSSIRMAAAQRLDQQYGQMMIRCAQVCVGERNVTDNDLFEISATIWTVGARACASPAQVMTQVAREYIYQRDPRLRMS